MSDNKYNLNTEEETEITTKNPCSLPCPKCGSQDIYRLFRRSGEQFNVCWGDKPHDTDFVVSDCISGFAKRDCIIHRCRCCEYRWETDPLQ